MLILDDSFKITIDTIFKPKKIGSVKLQSNKMPLIANATKANVVSDVMSQADDRSNFNRAKTLTEDTDTKPQVSTIKSVEDLEKTSRKTKDNLGSPSLIKPQFRISGGSATTANYHEKVSDSATPTKNVRGSKKLIKQSTHKEINTIKELTLEQDINGDQDDKHGKQSDSVRERVYYKTDSDFPIPYADNRMNLWYVYMTFRSFVVNLKEYEDKNKAKR